MKTPDRIRVLRQQRGLSAGDIGRMVGVTAQMVGRWEKGKDVPSLEHRRRVEALWQRLDPLTLRKCRPYWSVPDGQLLAIAREGRAEIARAEGFERPIGGTL